MKEQLDFETAWDITRQCCSYTRNHTILPEALEKWSVKLFEELLPGNHLMLIYQINEHIMNQVNQFYPGNIDKMRNLSVIEEGPKENQNGTIVLMAHTVNGVAELHTRILKERIFPEFL